MKKIVTVIAAALLVGTVAVTASAVSTDSAASEPRSGFSSSAPACGDYSCELCDENCEPGSCEHHCNSNGGRRCADNEQNGHCGPSGGHHRGGRHCR